MLLPEESIICPEVSSMSHWAPFPSAGSHPTVQGLVPSHPVPVWNANR